MLPNRPGFSSALLRITFFERTKTRQAVNVGPAVLSPRIARIVPVAESGDHAHMFGDRFDDSGRDCTRPPVAAVAVVQEHSLLLFPDS